MLLNCSTLEKVAIEVVKRRYKDIIKSFLDMSSITLSPSTRTKLKKQGYDLKDYDDYIDGHKSDYEDDE